MYVYRLQERNSSYVSYSTFLPGFVVVLFLGETIIYIRCELTLSSFNLWTSVADGFESKGDIWNLFGANK